MDAYHTNQHSLKRLSASGQTAYDPLQKRLRQWQQVRTWARLIKEAESLWHVDSRSLRRIGALELSQLLAEVPPLHRGRVNRWLDKYSVVTRFEASSAISKKKSAL